MRVKIPPRLILRLSRLFFQKAAYVFCTLLKRRITAKTATKDSGNGKLRLHLRLRVLHWPFFCCSLQRPQKVTQRFRQEGFGAMVVPLKMIEKLRKVFTFP